MSEHFTLFDAGGEQHRALRETAPTSIPGGAAGHLVLKTARVTTRLHDGRDLRPIGEGQYEIVESGERLYPSNPLLGFDDG